MATREENTDRYTRTRTDTAAEPQTGSKHPDEWEQDLNPNRMAGQNVGPRASRAEQEAPTAHDVRAVQMVLRDEFSQDELKQVTVLQEGQRLQQGGRYVLLRLDTAEREEFTATGNQKVGPGQRIVPKATVPYSIWNRLVGVENPERIPERGAERSA